MSEEHVPMTEFVKELASRVGREAAELVLEKHVATCPVNRIGGQVNGLDR
jgi:hypothetical protein